MSRAADQWAAAKKKAREPKGNKNCLRMIALADAKKPRKKGPAGVQRARPGDATPKEHYSQARVATFLDWSGLIWCHIGNERVKKSEAGKLASQGIKRGVPDIMIYTPPPGGRLVGLAIELKRISRKAKSNPVAGASADQLEWGDKLQGCGWRWRVCYGHVEAIKEVCEVYGIELSKHERAIYLEEGLR